MALWAKIDVGLRHHPKLIGRPDADFRLWVGLILHAKEHCPDFIVRDLSPSDMRSAFGIKAPARVVVAGLAYFLGKGMLIEQPDGGLLIRDMEERQGRYDQEEQRDKWRDIKRRQRERSASSAQDNGGQFPSVLPLDLDLEKDLETTTKQKPHAQLVAKPPLGPPSAFVAYVTGQWPDLNNPADFEDRAREAMPGVDPLAEARKARGWELADPRHRKRKHGPFLWNWLTNAQERANKNGTSSSSPQRPGTANLHVDNDALNAEPNGRKML